ncbi:MAG: hypothetical protein ACE5HX_05480 [bacterium]
MKSKRVFAFGGILCTFNAVGIMFSVISKLSLVNDYLVSERKLFIHVISNPDDFYRDEKSGFAENFGFTDFSPEILRGRNDKGLCFRSITI